MDKYCPAFSHVLTLCSVGKDPHRMDFRFMSLGSFCPIDEVEQTLGCSNIVRGQEMRTCMSLPPPRMSHLPQVQTLYQRIIESWNGLCWREHQRSFQNPLPWGRTPSTRPDLWGICLCWSMSAAAAFLPHSRNLLVSAAHLIWVTQEGTAVFNSLYTKQLPISSFSLTFSCCSNEWTHQLNMSSAWRFSMAYPFFFWSGQWHSQCLQTYVLSLAPRRKTAQPLWCTWNLLRF